jgi:predicted NBD/HSP70 family sugar kinase
VADLRTLLRAGDAGNRRRVLQALMIRGGNQTDVAKYAGIAAATAGNILNTLEGEQVVRRQASGREQQVSLHPLTGVAVGIELGFQRTSVVARRVDSPHLAPVGRQDDVGARHGVQAWSNAVFAAVTALAEELGESLDDVATVGLAVPGAVDPRSGLLTPPVFPLWRDQPEPRAELERLLRDKARPGTLRGELRVAMDNDGTLGALAESVHRHPDAEILLWVKGSTGVGGGLVVGGQVIRGGSGSAAEIGHIVVDPDGDYCQCGGRGCLETLIGANTLVRNVRSGLGQLPVAAQPTDLYQIADKARAGNQVCLRVLREAAFHLGLVLGNVCNVLNPNIVLLGGALGSAHDLILADCRSAIDRTALAAVRLDASRPELVGPREPDAKHPRFRLEPIRLPEAIARGALILGIQGAGFAENR